MHTMNSMVQNSKFWKGVSFMNNEKTYKLMSVIGAGNLALGIVVLVAGIVSGILMIVGGARLLKGKSDLLF